MKFHCDRCKTRYSIADERVRGKILKVRCKNCSAVITVRESGGSAAPKLPAAAVKPAAKAEAPAIPAKKSQSPSGNAAGPALANAFQKAMRRGMDSQRVSDDGAASGGSAPATLEAEWYVSLDGDQQGPYTLAVAQDWVASQDLDEELYCWSEGFDDWLPVEKVSHFRGLREQEQNLADTEIDERTVVDAPPSERLPPPSSLPVPRMEDTPVPLFAATMAQVASEAPTATEEEDGFGIPRVPPAVRKNSFGAPPLPSALPKPKRESMLEPMAVDPDDMGDGADAGDSLNFDIGEPSRVVKVSMIAGASSAGLGAAPALPGVGQSSADLGRGTGSTHVLGSTGPLPLVDASMVTSSPDIVQMAQVSLRPGRKSLLIPILIAALLLIGVVVVVLVVSSGGDGEDGPVARGKLAGQGLAYQLGEQTGKGPQGKATVEDGPEGSTNSSKGRGIRKTNNNTSGGTTTRPIEDIGDEVDLGGSSDAVGELGPDDLFSVYQTYKAGVKMCYQSALKRDPLLKVTRADVFIRVNTGGAVSSASVPSLAGTALGSCLEKRIKVWRFPKSKTGLSSKFPIMFDT